jgi:hypothetical protein
LSPTVILEFADKTAQDIVEATFIFRNLAVAPAIRLLLFIFTVEIAGSSDQSAILDRLEVVAKGTPFKRSTVPPAVVKVAPSNTTATVEILLMYASSASKNIVETEPACRSKIFALAWTSRVDVIVLKAYTVEKFAFAFRPAPPSPDKGSP